MRILRTIARRSSYDVDSEEKGLIGEIKVSRLLVASGEKHFIKNLVLVDEKGDTHQIDHLVVRNNGIFALEVKNISGAISGRAEDPEWFAAFPNGDRYSFINPLRQNASHTRYVEHALDDRYRVHSVVVLVQGKAKRLGIPNVLNYIDLPDYLEGFDDGTHYSEQQVIEIYDALSKADACISRREHARRLAARQAAATDENE